MSWSEINVQLRLSDYASAYTEAIDRIADVVDFQLNYFCMYTRLSDFLYIVCRRQIRRKCRLERQSERKSKRKQQQRRRRQRESMGEADGDARPPRPEADHLGDRRSEAF